MHKKIKVVGCTVAGQKNSKSGLCQDMVFIHRDPKQRVGLIALADGAGSCSFSHLGAECIVNNLKEKIENSFARYYNDNQAAKKEIIEHLKGRLRMLSQEKRIDFKQLSSTLLFVYFKCSKSSVEYIAGHVGDGVVVVTDGESTDVLSHPVRGEYANSTIFLTSEQVASNFQIYSGRIVGKAGFMLMSDGAAESLYNRSSRMPAPACKKIFQWFDRYSQEKCQKYLINCIEKILTRRTHDDCGIAVAKVIL